MDIKNTLSKIRCFVLDMDGTIYLGGKLFPFTKDFLKIVKDSGRKFYFFTNNSSKNANSYIEKLHNMGIDIDKEQMMISNHVIMKFLKESSQIKSAYVLGTKDFTDDVKSIGIKIDHKNPDCVILAFDTTLNYEKLCIATDLMRRGKPLFGVNEDLNCPMEDGFIPDCGSMAKLLCSATGKSCEFFGKPTKKTREYIIEHTGFKDSEIAIIGDRIYTDIKTAKGSDMLSILVLSGETKSEDLKTSEIKPDIVINDISELTTYLQNC